MKEKEERYNLKAKSVKKKGSIVDNKLYLDLGGGKQQYVGEAEDLMKLGVENPENLIGKKPISKPKFVDVKEFNYDYQQNISQFAGNKQSDDMENSKDKFSPSKKPKEAKINLIASFMKKQYLTSPSKVKIETQGNMNS